MSSNILSRLFHLFKKGRWIHIIFTWTINHRNPFKFTIVIPFRNAIVDFIFSNIHSIFFEKSYLVVYCTSFNHVSFSMPLVLFAALYFAVLLCSSMCPLLWILFLNKYFAWNILFAISLIFLYILICWFRKYDTAFFSWQSTF